MPEPVEVFAVPLGPLQANCFIVVQGEQGLVIDPGDEANVVIEAFTEFGFAPAAVLVTHGHFDHFGGVTPVARHFDIPVYVGAEDAGQMADGGLGSMAGFDIEPVETARTIEGEQTLDLPIAVLAIPTPGHSRGSYTFAIGEEELFVGDLLFQGSVGRTDLPGGNMDALLNSVADAHPPLPAGRHRAQRSRPGHVARPRARAQPVPLAHPPRPGAPLVSSPRAPKGTYDLLPDEAAERDAVVAAAARVFAAYGYRHVVTPEFEETGLFERGVGEATDIVRKEMYTFTDKGERLADAASRGHGAHLPRLRGARHAQAAAAGEALVLLPDVPLREAAGRPLPRALPDRRRGHRLRRAGRGRGGRSSCWRRSSPSSASRASPST